MKKIFLITLILLLQSFPSYSEWTFVVKGNNGQTFNYVDLKRIRTDKDFKYFWSLMDLNEKNKFGIQSYLTFFKVECKLLRYKFLTQQRFETNMGKGQPIEIIPSEPNEEKVKWRYPKPNGMIEKILNRVCDY